MSNTLHAELPHKYLFNYVSFALMKFLFFFLFFAKNAKLFLRWFVLTRRKGDFPNSLSWLLPSGHLKFYSKTLVMIF